MPNILPELTAIARKAMPLGITDDLARKQLIQGVIVKALAGCGALDILTMQGGSCISGCYGGNRLSEDLDFEMDELPSMELSEEMKLAIEKAVRAAFDAEVYVKQPTEQKLLNPAGSVPVGKWLTRVEVMERRPDIPRAVVKLEIAKVPHQTSVARRFSNSALRSVGIRDSIVLAEDVEELIADKVVSLLSQEKVLRIRDVWDLSYLLHVRDISRPLARELVKTKIEAYGLESTHLASRIAPLESEDWPRLFARHLVPMMTTQEAADAAGSPRVAAAYAAEAFEIVRYAMQRD